MTPDTVEQYYARYSNRYVAAQNDIGTTLVVRTQQDESPDDLHYEVLIHDEYTFYFNTGEEFYDWIDRLKKAFPRPEPLYLRKDAQ